MTTTNTYTDTKAIDYLEAIKRNQLESRNISSSSSNFDITYMLPIISDVSITSVTTATAGTLGDYQVINSYNKLIAYLPFDYDVLDALNNNDGTVTGTTTWADGAGVTGDGGLRKAFDFNGSSYISLANESNFDFNRTDTLSITAWVKVPTIDTGVWNLLLETGDIILAENSDTLTLEAPVNLHTIVSKIASTTTPGYYLWVTLDGLVHFIIQNSTSDKIEVKTTTALSTLYNHISVTYSGSGAASGVKIYINGTSDTLTTVTDTSTATALNNNVVVIGALGDASNKITGQIDEVNIWNVTLTAGNITDIVAGKQVNKTSVTNPAVLGLSDVT